MFSHNGANRPESQSAHTFCPVYQWRCLTYKCWSQSSAYLARPACLLHAKGRYKMCRCYFLTFNCPLCDSYLRMYWTDLHQIIRIRTYVGGHDNPVFFSRLVKGRCYGNRFLAPSGKNWHTHLYSLCWHSTIDGWIATWMRASTPPMILLRILIIR